MAEALVASENVGDGGEVLRLAFGEIARVRREWGRGMVNGSRCCDSHYRHIISSGRECIIQSKCVETLSIGLPHGYMIIVILYFIIRSQTESGHQTQVAG
jgi:hypothetical protein